MSATAPPKAFVIGWPIAQSRSPVIHRYWLEKYSIAGSYEAIAVEPDRVSAFLAGFADDGFVGGNVTIPHKTAAFAAADETDDTARILNAVNTLWREDGRLCGTNTDVYGFLKNLEEKAPGWSESGGAATILGAGGAARAIAYSLIGRGFDPVRIVNRTVSRAADLATLFGPPVTSHAFNELAGLLGDTAVLVNTTSLGMINHDPLEIDLEPLPATALVTDIVYVPIETGLLAAARARGNRTVDGLGMLLHQAVPGFQKWFGIRPEVDAALRQRVLADIGAVR